MTARPWFPAVLLLAAAMVAGLISLGAGDGWINPFSPASALEQTILWDLRLPRILTAFAVGGLLALAGAWFQVLLVNPLAEPYVLGVAGSSAVGAICGIAFMPQSVWAVSAGAFAGAWIGIAAILAFAHLGPARLLLAGVVLAAFWGACVALLLALLPARQLGMAFGWLMGDLSASAIPVTALLLTWVVALACGMALARSLDMLLLGEAHAVALGADIRRLRLLLLLLASAVTSVAVAAAGTIGFVGLVVPHMMRLMFGSLHRMLLPASAVGGGMLLVLADAGARTVMAPAELPVGVITALIGVPVFLWLLLRRG
ncbi:MAG: iron chelate uptake ABC transporter family permease subunit [Mariprofundaceae bacterium]|nr:iron chelate uptake ABC transporter family permease subunit [Mariprofundaceae bacterium]